MFTIAAVTKMGVDVVRTVSPIVDASGGALVRNDLELGHRAPIVIIFARGTVELGNMGSQVGVPLQEEVNALFNPGSVLFQGVNCYPAGVGGYAIGGSELATANMIAQINRAAVQCPGSKIFVAGYSQGAQITRKALARLSHNMHSLISGVILLGDPLKGQPLPGNLDSRHLSICNTGDLITLGIPIPLGHHLNYTNTTPHAAKWIFQMAQRHN